MTGQTQFKGASKLAVNRWFHSAANTTLASLKDESAVIEAFRMLCPGCVSHGTPRAQGIHQQFGDDIAMLGFLKDSNTTDAMTPASLEAVLHEFRITIPFGGDALAATSVHSEASFPATAYATRKAYLP